MKTVTMVPLPCTLDSECTVELPAGAEILRMQLVAKIPLIRGVNAHAVDVEVSVQLRVLADQTVIPVPRRLALVAIGSSVPDDARFLSSVTQTLPDGQKVNMDLFEILAIRPQLRTALEAVNGRGT